MQEAINPASYFPLVAALVFAYIIFGIVGFGTALIASPIMALYMPMAKIVPLLALLDFCTAVVNVSRDARSASWEELKKLIPLMVCGSIIGATILLETKPEVLLLALGVFVFLYPVYALSGVKPAPQFSPKASIPFGVTGGIFSSLLGSG